MPTPWSAVLSRTGRASVALAAAAAIATAGAAGAAGAPTEPVAPDLAKAAHYLVSQLVGGDHYEPFGPGFADIGLTTDAAFALAATQSDDATLGKIVSYLAAHVDDYTLITSDPAHFETGAAAKLALLAETTGQDPHKFGGDLITALDQHICSAGGTPGCTAPGDYTSVSSVFSQSLGVLAQARADDAKPATVTRLEQLQCIDGGFPSIVSAPGTTCVSDVDSAGMAIQALALAPDAAARTAVGKGLSYLAGQQKPSGAFPGAAGDSTNSTALALQAFQLRAGQYAPQISKGRTFLAAEQNADGGFRINTDPDVLDSDLRASTQSLGGAVGTPFGSVLDALPAKAAAAAGIGYLVHALAGSDHLATQFGPDYGQSADLAIALAAAGGQDPTLAKVIGYLFAHVADYADPAGKADFPGPFSGAAGKLAVLAEIVGANPRRLGGYDLLGTLNGHVCATADADSAQAGTCTAVGDFYQSFSTVSQALGVLALARGGVAPDPRAVARLQQLQCPDGGFSSTLIAPGAICASEVDTTAFAIQALALVPGAATSVGHARDFLVRSQHDDGSYSGASGVSTNSTAVATMALHALSDGATAPASESPTLVRPATALDPADPIMAQQAALRWLPTLQNSDGGSRINTDAANAQSDIRSTTQVVAALAQQDLVTLAHSVAPVTGTSGSPTGGSTSSEPSSGGSSSGHHSPASRQASGHGPDGLADTGIDGRHLGTELVLAGLLLGLGGAALLAARRIPHPNRRH